MDKLIRIFLLGLLFLGDHTGAFAADAPTTAVDAVLEARVMRIASELRCLVCQNQTIADSHAGLAVDLRNQVREMLKQGQSEAEITAYMTARYGDFVLYRPPLKTTTYLLWLGPLVMVFGGLATLVWVLRRRSQLPPSAFDPEPGLVEDPRSETLMPMAKKTMENATQSLKKQLLQLQELHRGGALTDAHYQESKAALERRLVDSIVLGTSGPTPGTNTPNTPSSKLVAGLLLGVVAIALLGYGMTRTPWQPDTAPSAVSGQEPPHATDSGQMARMTEQLALRMQGQPDDADGWSMLARSYSVLGQHPEALKAYERAIALRKDDAALLADYADALALQNGRKLAGKPMRQVEAALKIDPRNLKALALAGTHAFDTKDYAKAAQYWEQAVNAGPPGHPMVGQLTAALAEARSLAGRPANGVAEPQPAPGGGETNGRTLGGTVTLSAALAQRAQPDDTVFIFARAAEGSRMPLAILRKQVRDLPFAFALDDATAMSPANTLSTTTGKVIIGARISKSGNATPQPGDLTGQSLPVSVGSVGLLIDIKDVVKP